MRFFFFVYLVPATNEGQISTVLLNVTPSSAEGLNLNAKAKVPGAAWGKGSSEDQVIIMNGELLCGTLDKSAFGASDFGLVHSVYELYGADVAGRLLGILSRLFTKFLQLRAFTCRMDDLALTDATTFLMTRNLLCFQDCFVKCFVTTKRWRGLT